MKIALISGVKGFEESTKIHGTYPQLKKKHLDNLAFPETQIELIFREPSTLEIGANIESGYDAVIVAPSYCKAALESERKGFDAVIIGCFQDPGLHGCREIVDIPVVGTGQASMLLAMSLGNNFSIITLLPNSATPIRRNVKIYGVDSKIASVRWIDSQVRDLYKDEEQTKKLFITEALVAIKKDNAEGIIPGCGHFSIWAQELQETLGVPVIDPAGAALKLAESLVQLHLSHSKKTYPKPLKKKM